MLCLPTKVITARLRKQMIHCKYLDKFNGNYGFNFHPIGEKKRKLEEVEEQKKKEKKEEKDNSLFFIKVF